MKRKVSRLTDELQIERRILVRFAKQTRKLGNSDIAKVFDISREAVRKILLKRTK